MEKNSAIPVKKNEYYELKIEDIGTQGEGIGKIDGYTLFVKDALPNDTVKVKVTKVNKGYGFAKLISILNSSPNRCEPVCELANVCGGCQLQHLDYKAQLVYKKGVVANALTRIAGIDKFTIYDTLGMDEPYYYRNKVQFPVGNKNGEIIIGFYQGRSHTIIETSKCYIHHQINEQIIQLVKAYMVEAGVSAYQEERHSGLIRHIVTRRSYESGQVVVTIVINGKQLKNEEVLISKLRQIPEISGICININKEKTNVILGKTLKTIWGEPYIMDRIGDVQFRISPLSFYQVNPIQTKKLYEKALEFANLTGEEVVLDAYCGIGTITLFLAQKAKQVYGVEIVDEAIIDARKNAELNGIHNAEFFVGKAEEVIPNLYRQEHVKPDIVVVDPPRKGCDEALLKTILEINPRTIVYVSCDPGTLARDVKVLAAGGYKVEKVQPVDMFPMTAHVETVCLLTRK
jgi:23S rRNA (uracil1939-C5)-methyltransferase